MAIELTYHLPDADLLPLVAGGYVIRCTAPEAFDQITSLLGQLHWVLAGEIAYSDGEGAYRPVPANAVIGPTTRSPTVRFRGPLVLVGVGMMVPGWQQWLRLPAAECANLIAPMEAVAPGLAALADRLDPAASDAALARAMYGHLQAHLREPARRAQEARAIDRWLIEDARAPAALAGELGISARQLNRIVLETHGAPLRLLGIKYRTLRCAARLATGTAGSWSEAFTDEFCDQPHLIRSFNRFIGATPKAFLSDDAAFARSILRQRMTIRPDNLIAAWG